MAFEEYSSGISTANRGEWEEAGQATSSDKCAVKEEKQRKQLTAGTSSCLPWGQRHICSVVWVLRRSHSPYFTLIQTRRHQPSVPIPRAASPISH